VSSQADRGRTGLALAAPSWVPACAGASVGAAAVATRARGRARGAALLLAGAGAAVTAFFRDPNRDVGEGLVLAPADGIVSEVERSLDGRVRVATFMGLQNVHVNRAPIDGVVRDLEHHPGGYRPAFRKDSKLNERMVWTLETALGEVRMVQIAGLLARRIVPYREPGQRIARGERIGMIRFGSRVDVTLPAGVEPAVEVGQRVRAGQTRFDLP
jgi:phosphatidylserine decarboxylase